jgi:hypothetical protein
VRTGVNYLLQLLCDCQRLPVPTATDPFLLRWFEIGSLAHDALGLGDADRVERMKLAELALRGACSTSLLARLAKAESEPSSTEP